VRGLVGILESSPPADIKDQDGVKLALDRERVAKKLLEGVPSAQGESADPVHIYENDLTLG